jgi:hypothetical protein
MRGVVFTAWLRSFSSLFLLLVQNSKFIYAGWVFASLTQRFTFTLLLAKFNLNYKGLQPGMAAQPG